MTKELDVFNSVWEDYKVENTDFRIKFNDKWTPLFFEREVQATRELIISRVYYYETHSNSAQYYIQCLAKKLLQFSRDIIAFPAFFKLLGDAIDQLIDFLLKEYGKYFDFDTKANAGYQKQVIGAMKENVSLIRTMLIKPDLDPRLVSVINNYLDLEGDITFKQLHYYKRFCEVAPVWFQGDYGKDDNINWHVISGLVHINFNSTDLINVLRSKVQELCPDPSEVEEGASECALCLRNTKFIQQQNLYAYDSNTESLKAVLIKFLEAEQQYLTFRLDQLTRHQFTDEVIALDVDEFITVNLTIEQLVYFLRSLVECGIILVKDQGKFYDFITHRFRTINKLTSLSRGSMKNKFNNVKESTKKFVGDLFITLHNHTKKIIK